MSGQGTKVIVTVSRQVWQGLTPFCRLLVIGTAFLLFYQFDVNGLPLVTASIAQTVFLYFAEKYRLDDWFVSLLTK